MPTDEASPLVASHSSNANSHGAPDWQQHEEWVPIQPLSGTATTNVTAAGGLIQPTATSYGSNTTTTSINPNSSKLHLQTYTAGEDASRLAAAAKEFGLAHKRQPRAPVRREKSYRSAVTENLVAAWNLLLSGTEEESLMWSVYSSHKHDSAFPYAEQRRASLPILDKSELPTIEEPTDGDEELARKPSGDEEALDPHHVNPGGTLTAAVLGIIKGMVGPAILYLPHGFAKAGYAIALPMLCVTTCMFLYSAQRLLDAWKQQKSAAKLSYPELAYLALGTPGETVVKCGIALMQSGVCLTYLIFVPQNLHTSMKLLFGVDAPPSVWLLAMLAMEIPLSWIRDIRKLTITNLLANVLILYGLITCLGFAMDTALTTNSSSAATSDAVSDDAVANGDDYYGDDDTSVADALAAAVTTLTAMDNLLDHIKSAILPFDSDWFLFIGTSVLLFEGSITLLVPLQEAVQKKEDRERFPAVFRTVIICIIVFYAIFGMACWMAFGHDVHVVLTTSLPSGGLATTVQLAYSLAVILTFPLQNFPALEIAASSIPALFLGRPESQSPTQQQCSKYFCGRNVLATIMVLSLAVVAVCTMDSLDKVVSLMGSLLGCPIAFCFPPLIHTRLCGSHVGAATVWINWVVFGLGFVAMVYAASITLLTWHESD